MTDTTDPQQAAPVCKFDEGCHRVVACDPGCAVTSARMHAQLAAAPSAPAGRAALRDLAADALADAEGWQWAPGYDKAQSPTYQHYLRQADAVLAVLPAPADRTAGPAALREAAAFYESVLQQSLDPDSDPRYCTAVRDVVMGLRHRADEAQQDAPWLSDSARIGRTLIWTWADIGKGVYGQGYRAAQTEARALLTGQRDSDEAQQPETQADAHPPTVTWEIESPRRGTWASWGTTYDEHDWARQRFEDAIGHVPARQFRLVRATTVYAVEAEHTPAAVCQPDVARQADTAGEQQ